MTSIRAEVSRDVISLDGSASLRAAAILMEERRIGSVGVLEAGALVGLVTESDLVTASLVQGAPPETAIRRAMRPVPVVTADLSVDACQATMRDHRTRHLLVEERGTIVGIITMRHILRLMLEEQRWTAQQLEDYITGAPAQRPTA
jgi:CBS domain-containing protein